MDPHFVIIMLLATFTASSLATLSSQARESTMRYQQEEPSLKVQREEEMRRFYHQEQEPPPDRYNHVEQGGRPEEQAMIKHGTLEQNRDYRLEDDDDFRREDDDDFRREDDDDFRREDDDDFRRQSNLVQELAKLQTEGHSLPPKKKPLADEQSEGHSLPPKKPKRVTFEEDTDMDALVQRLMMQADSQDVSEEDDDDAMSQLVMVTSEGYEYSASRDELDSVFRSESDESSRLFEISEPSSDALGARFEASINATGQRVIGHDSRFRVYNGWRYPMAAMGQVGYGCTGTFISHRHILTAGHCVFNPFTKKWIRNLNFRRGKNGNSNPGIFYRWKNAVTVWGWVYGKRDYDYAVIVVSKPSPTWMSFGYRDPMPRYYVNMVGYPTDKPGNYMWHSFCRLRRTFHNAMSYFCDTYYGMSGAAVYAHHRSWIWRYSVIYGVHVGSSRYKNVATRINRRRYKTLNYIIRRYR